MDRLPGQPFIVVISYDGDVYNKDIKGDAYYTISREDKEKIWYDDGIERSWPISKSFTPIVVDWIKSGLNLIKGDLFYLTWDISYCNYVNTNPVFYWDGKKVKSARIIFSSKSDIYFPNFPLNYYKSRFDGRFQISPFLRNMFKTNATYGVPPYVESKDEYDRQEVFYSWFWYKTNNKYIQYWVESYVDIREINEHTMALFKECNMPFHGSITCNQCYYCMCDKYMLWNHDNCTHGNCSCNICSHDDCKQLCVFGKDMTYY